MLAAVLLLAGAAYSHAIGTSCATVRVDEGRVEASLVVRTSDLALALGLDRDGDGRLSSTEVDLARISRHLLEEIVLVCDGARRDGTLRSIVVREATLPGVSCPQQVVEATIAWAGVRGEASLEIAPFRAADPEHACLGKVVRNGEETGFVFRAGAPCPLTQPTSGALRFLRLGVEHILSGFDHVLFLVSLLVAMPRRCDLIATISAFTLGHTATLILATLRLFVLPPAIVEPAIALSVLYVSLENVLGSPGRHRAWLACAFGLVHGMGFSGALSGLHLSGGALAAALASFNAGVEAGQLLIVAAVCPLLAWWHARRPDRCRRVALQGGSIAIAVVAAAWFLERV